MKQMIRNWREIEGLGNFLYRDANGNVRITEQFYDMIGDNPLIVQNLKDGEGRKRFIEGNGTPISLEGLTINLCKWSLSGTHLIFVIGGSITETTVITNNSKLAEFELPEWVHNQIIALFYDYIVASDTIKIYAQDWSYSALSISLDKRANNKIEITSQGGSFTAAKNGNFRFMFDLYISLNN